MSVYLPAHFEENSAQEIRELVEHFPLAAVVCCSEGEFIVNHVPLIRQDDSQFLGHIAKANPLHSAFPDGTDAVAIFSAEDSYISPNWYPSKKQTHRHVPTWNYQVVHLHGRIRFEHSSKSKLSVVGKLTKKYERMVFGEDEWKMSDAPRRYIEEMLENIVAFAFSVDKIVAKNKLSQNRERIDFESVARAMRDSGKTGLAKAMERIGEDA